jgi:hypothetical protein
MASCTCNFVQVKTDFSSCLRHSFGYVLFLHFEASDWFLVCWKIASHSYMSSHMAFLAVNMELSGTTRQVPSFGI